MKSLWVLWSYCILLLIGGAVGYIVGGSRASLISSLLSGSIVLTLSYFVAKHKRLGIVLTVSFLIFLDAFFTYRWLSTGSVPAAVMAFASLATLLGFATIARKELLAKSKSN